MSRYVGAGKKLMSFLTPKANVPKTELQKKTRDLKIATQKNKASKAKLDQTIFELKNNKPFTFKSTNKKSESNTESYKRITGENNKVIKNMLDKATENKKDGGRMGYKVGGRIGLKKGTIIEQGPPGTEGQYNKAAKDRLSTIVKNKKTLNSTNPKISQAKKDKAEKQNEFLQGGDGQNFKKPVKQYSMGGRIGRKFGSPNPRKSNVQKIKETFGSKKNVPSKLKGFSKLPEKVQQQMNKKLARKV
tara:strand:- start:69 stop:806 length:738 start_codon:yes stop_codon:yes gene_type:complete